MTPVPQEIIGLIERFDANREAYQSGVYNETQLRREFIDPFFKALGWDVDNEKGYAEAYKDVIHEDSIKVGGFTKARTTASASAGRVYCTPTYIVDYIVKNTLGELLSYEIRNSKSEIRNPKLEIRNSKSETRNLKRRT